MADNAPKVTILSWVPSYGEVKYLIGDKKYSATGLSPAHMNKVRQSLKHGANGDAINYLKKFEVEPIKESSVNISNIVESLVAAETGTSQEKLVKFFVDNPNPNDASVHAFAEKLGVEPDDLETEIYKLATIAAEFLDDGRSNEKGVKKGDVDAKELKIGIEIEKEHTPNADITARIALDHLAELPADAPMKYYTGLKLLEKFMESLVGDKNAAKRIEAFKKACSAGD